MVDFLLVRVRLIAFLWLAISSFFNSMPSLIAGPDSSERSSFRPALAAMRKQAVDSVLKTLVSDAERHNILWTQNNSEDPRVVTLDRQVRSRLAELVDLFTQEEAENWYQRLSSATTGDSAKRAEVLSHFKKPATPTKPSLASALLEFWNGHRRVDGFAGLFRSRAQHGVFYRVLSELDKVQKDFLALTGITDDAIRVVEERVSSIYDKMEWTAVVGSAKIEQLKADFLELTQRLHATSDKDDAFLPLAGQYVDCFLTLYFSRFQTYARRDAFDSLINFTSYLDDVRDRFKSEIFKAGIPIGLGLVSFFAYTFTLEPNILECLNDMQWPLLIAGSSFLISGAWLIKSSVSDRRAAIASINRESVEPIPPSYNQMAAELDLAKSPEHVGWVCHDAFLNAGFAKNRFSDQIAFDVIVKKPQ